MGDRVPIHTHVRILNDGPIFSQDVPESAMSVMNDARYLVRFIACAISRLMQYDAVKVDS